MSSTAAHKIFGSNKQRKGGGEIRHLINLFVLCVVKVLKNVSNYGIIMKRFYTVKRRDENVFIKQATYTAKNVSYGL